jgi:hypothetical protein
MRQITPNVRTVESSRSSCSLQIELLRAAIHANGFFQASARLRKGISMRGIGQTATMFAGILDRSLQRSFAF